MAVNYWCPCRCIDKGILLLYTVANRQTAYNFKILQEILGFSRFPGKYILIFLIKTFADVEQCASARLALQID